MSREIFRRTQICPDLGLGWDLRRRMSLFTIQTMKNPARFLLAALLLAVPLLSAQAPAPNTGVAKAPVMKSWFIRLIPPRPTFDKDLSEAESKLMAQHFVYWKGLFDKDVCIFGGPVFDPRGVYGVLAIRAAGEDEARALASADPAVKAGVQRIKLAEMRAVFLPGPH